MATYNAKKLTLVNQNGDVYVIDPLQGNESVYLDLPVTIAQNQWSGTAPYTYTYTNSHITANAALCVYFKDGVREGLVGDLKWSKATGSITFVTTEPAAGPVPLVVRVIDSTTNGTYPIDASMVETDAVVGETTVQGALEDLDSRITSIWETIYPVGSIYMSVASTSPGTLFGGTWERLKSRFLLGAEDTGDTTGDPYVGGATGGAASVNYTPTGTVDGHTLTTAEIPSHSHGLNGHTHTIPAHDHGLAGHKHGVGSYAAASGGKHDHGVQGYYQSNDSGGSKCTAYKLISGDSEVSGSNSPITKTGSEHSHSVTGTSAGCSTNTSSKTAFSTQGSSEDTAAKGDGGAHSHGFTGTVENISTMPPFLAVYMWKRTA